MESCVLGLRGFGVLGLGILAAGCFRGRKHIRNLLCVLLELGKVLFMVLFFPLQEWSCKAAGSCAPK